MAFSQFLADLQREMGRQAFLHEVTLFGLPDGTLPPKYFINLLKTACGWRLPQGIVDRLESIYCRDPVTAAEATAQVAVVAERLKGSNAEDAAKSASTIILANMEERARHLGERTFGYNDFLAFQEVFSNLPGICNLIHEACNIMQGPVSPDDFKVANRFIGLGGKMPRRQVEVVFQIFDLDRDGFVSGEDTESIVGSDFVSSLVATRGREGKLTFAPPPDFATINNPPTPSNEISDKGDEKLTFVQHIQQFLEMFGLAAIAGGIGATAVYPIDLVKTRMQNQRIGADGKQM